MSNALPAAQFAFDRGLTLFFAYQRASGSERDYVAALSVRYSSSPNPDFDELAAPYRDAMRALVNRYPSDADARAQFAEAIMDVHPWRLWDTDGRPAAGTEELVETLEHGLENQPEHIGSLHFYIHAVEASGDPAKAAQVARRLAALPLEPAAAKARFDTTWPFSDEPLARGPLIPQPFVQPSPTSYDGFPDMAGEEPKMAAVISSFRGFALGLALGGIGMFASGVSHAADIYDAAVQHAGRSADDRKRDALDHPAEILRLAGIKPGMRVGDFMASDGYYSELLSYIVGPKGHVLLINNPSFDRWANNAWQGRLAHNRLPNVEHRTVDLNHMSIADGSLDAVMVVKVYHDLYWEDTDQQNNWPKVDTPAVLDKLVKTLEPNGILVIVDHSSEPGAGNTVAGSLHRIEEPYAVRDFESRGMKLVAKSEALRMPGDPRTQVSYKEPILGKTDRFVLVFRKTGA